MVIGGDAGGMAAVSQMRKGRPEAEIVVLERGNWTSYSACGIPFVIGGEIETVEQLQARTPQQFRDRDRIDVRMRQEVMSIDLAQRFVEVRAHEQNRTYRLGFDQMLIGTGGSPITPDLPGIDLPNVHRVQTLDNAAALLAAVERGTIASAVVVGGGYIGLEMAEAFCRRGAKVTLVEASDQIMRTFDADMAKPIMKALGAHGIEVGLGVRVTGFETDGVITTSGKIAADVVVLGIGIMPNSALAGAAGLDLGVRNAISVDRRQQTSAEGIYAAGDCAESFHLVSRRNVHIALGTVANKQSRVAGINLGGGYATFPGVIGTAISKICSLEVARTGLTESEAADAGFGATAVSINATTRAGYFPGAEPITVKLVVERGSGRILGGQIAGGTGSGKRIDSIAVAVTAGWSAEDLLNADLAYAPPFSGVWDPVQIAAREALKI